MDRPLVDDVLVSLRRITRAIDLHSRQLVTHHGLTVPQLLALKELSGHEPVPIGELSRRIHLSAATVTSILGRLEARGLVARVRSAEDRRVVLVRLTPSGDEVVRDAPGLLQERFVHEFGHLRDWEQGLILSSLQRVAAMMDAGDLDAAPLLTPGSSVELEPEDWGGPSR